MPVRRMIDILPETPEQMLGTFNRIHKKISIAVCAFNWYRHEQPRFSQNEESISSLLTPYERDTTK